MKKNKSDINTQIQNICRLCGKKIELNRISLYAPDVQKFIEPDMCFDCIWNKIRNAGIKLLNKSNQKESKTWVQNIISIVWIVTSGHIQQN